MVYSAKKTYIHGTPVDGELDAYKLGRTEARREDIAAVCPNWCGKGHQPERSESTGIWWHRPLPIDMACPAGPIHELREGEDG